MRRSGEPYFDLGPYSRAVSTNSAEAQTWFDRGLMWAYGFNHEEALRCFEAAALADPTCGMAFWGQAYVQGPFYNKPWKFYGPGELRRDLQACRTATEAALATRGRASDIERALINALDVRYSNPLMSSQEAFDRSDLAYAAAMRAVIARWPDDDDVAALTAEALITRTPWQLWDTRSGEPAEGSDTLEAVALLEARLGAASAEGRTLHPGLCHMYIHTMEMSPNPEMALPAADAIRNHASDSGHLNHMPGHIDVLCGRYPEAMAASRRAVAADARYITEVADPGFYTTACAHNWHLMMYAAMLQGSNAAADAAVAGMNTLLPIERLGVEQPHLRSTLEAYSSMSVHVDVRFGRWDTIVAAPIVDDIVLRPVTTAMSRYAKGIAHAALGDLVSAEQHRNAFRDVVAEIPTSRRFFNNAATEVLAVGQAMLDGEVEYHAGNHKTAFEHLRDAVSRDDALSYSEPWPWMHPPRHALGALLLEQGHFEEATSVYRADLGLDPQLPRPCWHPENPWSLHGLVECYEHVGDEAAAAKFRPRLIEALEHVDFEMASSCACRLGRHR